MTSGRRTLSAALAAGVVLSVCVAVAAARPGGADGTRLLPDLDAVEPARVAVQTAEIGGRTRFRLGFVSAAVNEGKGPLTIRASRTGTEEPRMVAEQLVSTIGGGNVVVPRVGILEYIVDPTHQHWHYLGFMRYELRRASDFKLVRPDTKSGFCLGDRFVANLVSRLEGQPVQPAYNTNCGLDQPDLLSLEEGISVGYGDVYEAWRDGQYIDVTGLPAGRYVLVHRVNPARSLREASYANNASSAIVQLTWPNGMRAKPRARIVATCSDTARCRA